MKKRAVLLVFLVLLTSSALSQYVIKSQEELQNLRKLPLEKVYLSHTGPVLFSGEYLYYSMYCFNAQNSRPSDISKVGYVALVNDNREYVFEQKIKLEKGLGQGDLFMPTDLPSGNYKLLGYTQWMKNGGINQIFKTDIVIINPYLANQSSILSDGEGTDSLKQTGAKEMKMDSSTVSLVFDKKLFSKREKVNFSLRNYKGYLGNGAYSICIKKKGLPEAYATTNAIEFAGNYLNVAKEVDLNVGDSLFLPEQRGELLYGKVLDGTTKAPMTQTPVVVSLPGKEFVLKFSTTDDAGNFYTYLRKDYKEQMAVIQVEDSDKNADIQMKSPRRLDISKLKFGSFKMKPDLADYIRKRSIENQIENQFFGLKPDSVLLGDPIDPFDGGIPETFTLDEYTRFPTFQETLVEILNNAGYRNNPNGHDYIRIAQDFETFNEEYNSFPAIVLFDGVYIANHEAMKAYDARKIKSISLIRDQFQLANKEYQGIMAVETFDGDYFNQFSGRNGVQAEIVKPAPKKNYYVQTYEVNDPFSRIPDYRSLLLWKPIVVVEGNSLDFEFFTSDVAGEYEVIVDGFTSYGKPISFAKNIRVQ